LTLIWGGSYILINNIAHEGGQYLNYGLIFLPSHWIMQDTTSEIIDAPLILTSGGRDIVNDNIAHKGGKYFDYGLKMLRKPWIWPNAKP
jgi:hypothetical protein